MPESPRIHRSPRPKRVRRHVPADSADVVPAVSASYLAAKRIRSSGRWKRLSLLVLSRSPVCEWCGRRASVEAHHVEGVAKRPDLAYDSGNLVALCRRCHERIESAERRGVDTGELLRAGP